MPRVLLVSILIFLGAGCACPGTRLVKTRFVFDCGDGQVVRVRYAGNAKTMRMEYGGRAYRLLRTRSASGARYSNGRVTFWEKGGTAFLEKNGKVVEEKCMIVEPMP